MLHLVINYRLYDRTYILTTDNLFFSLPIDIDIDIDIPRAGSLVESNFVEMQHLDLVFPPFPLIFRCISMHPPRLMLYLPAVILII